LTDEELPHPPGRNPPAARNRARNTGPHLQTEVASETAPINNSHPRTERVGPVKFAHSVTTAASTCRSKPTPSASVVLKASTPRPAIVRRERTNPARQAG